MHVNWTMGSQETSLCWINGGSSELICISDDSLSGEWSDPTPTCEVIQCYDVGYPENANRIGNPPYFIGDEVKFRCMSGYDLIGSSSRTCQPNGKWSGYLTICDNGAGDCRNPGTPINGRKVGRRYMLGDVVTFKCNKGFAIIGTSERTCLNTGAWSGTQPTCRGPRDYDDPESIAQYFGKTLDKFHEDTAISSDGDSRGRTIDLSYGGRLEIYIAIDASGSIRKPNFDHAVEFAKALVRKTGVSGGRKGPWYAGLMYTNTIERDKYFHVTSTSKEDVLGEFDRFEYEEDGGTDTAAALNFVRTQMISFSKATFREEDERASSRIPPPKRVVFLLSDGASNSGGDPIKAAELLKDDGVEIYVIGVRLKKENDELLGIASTDLPGEHIFILADHNSLGRLADEITGKTKPDYSICGIAGDTQESSQRGRVSGGWEAIEGAWPWQAMLWKSQFDVNSNKYIPDDSLFCGGSIIDREWILTAAHCFRNYNKEDHIRPILVGLGYTNRFDKKEYTKQVTVKQVIKHGDYDSSTFDNDIALLKLKEPIEFSVYIQPVCLPNITREDKLKPNDIMVSTGWGNTKVQEIDKGRSKPDNLQQIYSKVRKDKDCSDNIAGTFYSFTNNMFCIDGQGNTTCRGDSGGPISKKVLPNDERDEHWVQFGIVSFGIGCGLVGKYDYHTDVTRFMDWIEDKTSLDFS
ncbi:complement factor B-like isoform X2 [Antedon mediterranea]|uniref:complement factor B-like isoform X2 n=1 Tax=Antedon mediterranea TaxID=105859 RepID=UPI003AF4F1FA